MDFKERLFEYIDNRTSFLRMLRDNSDGDDRFLNGKIDELSLVRERANNIRQQEFPQKPDENPMQFVDIYEPATKGFRIITIGHKHGSYRTVVYDPMRGEPQVTDAPIHRIEECFGSKKGPALAIRDKFFDDQS